MNDLSERLRRGVAGLDLLEKRDAHTMTAEDYDEKYRHPHNRTVGSGRGYCC